MTPICIHDPGYTTITYIDGMGTPELIKFLEPILEDRIKSGIEQRTDASCLNAAYIVQVGNDDDDAQGDLPPFAEIDEDFLNEDAEPEEIPTEEYPFFNEDGSKADVPGEAGEVIMLTINHLPEGSDDPADDFYDVLDLLSDGCGNYHVFDPNNTGLVIDDDKISYLIKILSLL